MNTRFLQFFTAGIISLLAPRVCEALEKTDITFPSVPSPALMFSPEISSGLTQIFILNDISSSLSLHVNGSNLNNPEFYTFGQSGATYNDRISDVIHSDNSYEMTIKYDDVKNDVGLMIVDGDKSYFYWIINYQKYYFEPVSLTSTGDIDCISTDLNFKGSALPIYYYGITGRRFTFNRDIKIRYYNLEWNSETSQFEQKLNEISSQFLTERMNITPPLYTSSHINIIGDCILKEWGKEITFESNIIPAQAVEVRTEMIQLSNDSPDNVISSSDAIGGSAPCVVQFNSFVSDEVVHSEWQMATDSSFDNITYRINSRDFEYTFAEEGTTYIRYIGSNADGSCEAYSETYEVTIGASELLIPNVFSPNDDGINDVWKVAYRSILNFDCWIFDRNGREIIHLNDPSQGWDGSRNGQKVSSGVYYYVINATGSDGKRYNKSGDINIISSNKRSIASDPE